MTQPKNNVHGLLVAFLFLLAAAALAWGCCSVGGAVFGYCLGIELSEFDREVVRPSHALLETAVLISAYFFWMSLASLAVCLANFLCSFSRFVLAGGFKIKPGRWAFCAAWLVFVLVELLFYADSHWVPPQLQMINHVSHRFWFVVSSAEFGFVCCLAFVVWAGFLLFCEPDRQRTNKTAFLCAILLLTPLGLSAFALSEWKKRPESSESWPGG